MRWTSWTTTQSSGIRIPGCAFSRTSENSIFSTVATGTSHLDATDELFGRHCGTPQRPPKRRHVWFNKLFLLGSANDECANHKSDWLANHFDRLEILLLTLMWILQKARSEQSDVWFAVRSNFQLTLVAWWLFQFAENLGGLLWDFKLSCFSCHPTNMMLNFVFSVLVDIINDMRLTCWKELHIWYRWMKAINHWFTWQIDNQTNKSLINGSIEDRESWKTSREYHWSPPQL